MWATAIRPLLQATENGCAFVSTVSPAVEYRVWPIAMVQLPTAIYMVSGFMNSLRTIFLDGRSHTDPDVVVRTFNGESIGHWEGDTLVVETKHFVEDDHHWVDQGVPASGELRIVERIRLVNEGRSLEIAFIAAFLVTTIGVTLGAIAGAYVARLKHP